MAEGTTHNLIIYFTFLLILIKGVYTAAPRFDYFPTPINVSESATFGDVIWSCNATDEDDPSTPEGRFRFEFNTKVNSPKWFLDSRTCEMYVYTGLNYENQQAYTLRIIVRDLHPTSPQTTTGTLTIQVTDVNDNAPICDEEYSVLSIREDTQVGKEIARATCRDYDRDKSTTGKIMFKVADSNSDEIKDTFKVNNDNGSVTVKKSLDYERVKSYILTIDVYDNAGVASLTTFITYNIQVKDIDDNKPTWPTNPLTLYVNESAALGNGVFTLTVNDGSTIQYGIQTPAVPDWFGIDSQTGLVYVKGILDCRIAPRLQMEVYAYSSNKITDRSVLAVDISITSFRQIGNDSEDNCVKNDFALQFDYFPTSIFIPETAMLGQRIWNCNATDGGGYQSEGILYQFAEQYDDWSLDSRYCIMYVNTRLDYEARSSYTLRVTANEHYTFTSRTITGTLTIHITDVNDNAPECSETSRVLFVPEDTPVNALIAKALCTDIDSYGGIYFNISDSNSNEVKDTFEVNNDNSSVKLKKSLDYERVKSYILTLDVYDNAGEASLTTIITYNIQVKDIDDNKPTWPTNPLTVYVRESAAPGTAVFTLTANDADNPSNDASTIRYGIQTPAVPDWFGIDSRTGLCYVKGFINTNKVQNGRMEVYAYSSNKSTDISILVVNIRIIDSYDTLSQFVTTPETSTVFDSTTNSEARNTHKSNDDGGGFVISLGIGIGSTLVLVISIILIVVCIYKYRNRNHKRQQERNSAASIAPDIGVAQEDEHYEELSVLNDVSRQNERQTNNA